MKTLAYSIHFNLRADLNVPKSNFRTPAAYYAIRWTPITFENASHMVFVNGNHARKFKIWQNQLRQKAGARKQCSCAIARVSATVYVILLHMFLLSAYWRNKMPITTVSENRTDRSSDNFHKMQWNLHMAY
jgi:hypothetical protein